MGVRLPCPDPASSRWFSGAGVFSRLRHPAYLLASDPLPRAKLGAMAAEKSQTKNWRAWGIGALVALVLIVALQNSQQVTVDVLFLTLDAPLIVTLLVAVAIGALIGYAAPVLLRHRRDERRRDSDS